MMLRSLCPHRVGAMGVRAAASSPPDGSHINALRPFRDREQSSSAMKSRYPVDIIGKSSLFPISFGIRLPRYVIKTETRKFKLPRIPASPCRVFVHPSRDEVGLTMDSSQPDADLYHLKIEIGMLPMHRKCLGILPTSMLAKALGRTSYVRTRHRTTAARVLPSRPVRTLTLSERPPKPTRNGLLTVRLRLRRKRPRDPSAAVRHTRSGCTSPASSGREGTYGFSGRGIQ